MKATMIRDDVSMCHADVNRCELDKSAQDFRPQAPGSRPQKSGARSPVTPAKAGAGADFRAPDVRPQAPGPRPQAPEVRSPVTPAKAGAGADFRAPDPKTLLKGYLSDSEVAKSGQLCLAFSFQQSKILQLLQKQEWTFEKVSYHRPIKLFEVQKQNQTKGYIGFLLGYGFQTLWVILSEMQAWGIQEVLFLGHGGHTFESEKGRWYRIQKAQHQIGCGDHAGLSDTFSPQKKCVHVSLDFPEKKAISIYSPYESSQLIQEDDVMVDMETGWFYEGCNRLGLGCEAMLMAYDQFGTRAYQDRIQAPSRPDAFQALAPVFDIFFA